MAQIGICDDIVCSAWEHAAVNNGDDLTTHPEHKERTELPAW